MTVLKVCVCFWPSSCTPGAYVLGVHIIEIVCWRELGVGRGAAIVQSLANCFQGKRVSQRQAKGVMSRITLAMSRRTVLNPLPTQCRVHRRAIRAWRQPKCIVRGMAGRGSGCNTQVYDWW